MIGMPGEPFAQIRRICEPLRAGTRFREVPSAQVWVAGGKLNRVGPFLPGPEEQEADYCARLAEAGYERFALRIIEPWARSPQWWSWMRDLAEPIWQERGLPVVPTDTELVYSHGLVPPVRQAEDQEAYGWLLSGACEPVQAVGSMWHCGAGEDLRPVGAPSALWQRLLLGTDTRRAVAVAAETIATELSSDDAGGPTPYTPWSAFGEEVPALREVSARVAAAVSDAGHERRLMGQWLRHCSAGAIEPVPPPRDALEADPGPRRYVRRSRVLHARVGTELLCAANGHLFAVAQPDLADLFVRINAVSELSPAELSDDWPEPVVRAVVSRLYRMHALEVAA